MRRRGRGREGGSKRGKRENEEKGEVTGGSKRGKREKEEKAGREAGSKRGRR
jgi:hypothetical protein